MTAETDLLPLPDWMECLGEISASDIRDYVRANIEHAIAAQAAEIEALRKDAARYRWLRKGNSDDIAVVRGLGAMDYGMSGVAYTYSEEIDGDDLDAAIDAALAQEDRND